MTAPSEDLINRLQAAATEARATVRELHEARRDARAAMAELQALVQRVREETIEGHNDLSMKWWKEAMDSINLTALGTGLKESFDRWVHQLAEATDVLNGLHDKDEQFAQLLTRARERGL